MRACGFEGMIAKAVNAPYQGGKDRSRRAQGQEQPTVTVHHPGLEATGLRPVAVAEVGEAHVAGLEDAAVGPAVAVELGAP